MKRMLLLAVLCCCLCLCACSHKEPDEDLSQSRVLDFTATTELAQTQFDTAFDSFPNLKVTQTRTMVRSGQEDRVVVVISYESDQGDGDYGYLYQVDKDGNNQLCEQGKDVTAYALTE